MAISVFIIVMNHVADAKVPEAVAIEQSGNAATHSDSVAERKTAPKRKTRASHKPRKTRSSDKAVDNGRSRSARNPLSEPVD